MSEFQVVHSLAEADWRRFIDTNPQAGVFHTPEMFRVFSAARGFEPQLWAVLTPGGEPLALFMPVRVSLAGGPLRILTTRAIAYGGVLCAPGEPGRRALAELLRVYKAENRSTALYTELRNLVDTRDLQPILSSSGFGYEPHLNYLVDLSGGPEAVFGNIGARTRKNIRHGLNRAEVNVQVIQDRARLAPCYDLLSKTYANARVPLAHASLFESAFDVLSPLGMIRFSLASVAGAPAASSVELLYRDQVYGWYGGLDREYARFSPNDLLTWNILEWSSRQGYRLYDFGGAGKPDEKYGVRDFKAKFGGALVSYGRNIWVHTPWLLRISTIGYGLVRSVFGINRQPAGSGGTNQ